MVSVVIVGCLVCVLLLYLLLLWWVIGTLDTVCHFFVFFSILVTFTS